MIRFYKDDNFANKNGKGQISEEEFLVLINSSKEVEKGMNQIKVKWQQSEY